MPLFTTRLRPLLVRKAANESVTSSTALQDDNHLFLPVSATSVYLFELFLIADGAQAGDLIFDFTFPAGAAVHFHPLGLVLGATAATGDMKGQYGTTSENVGLAGAGTKTVTRPRGVLLTGSTAGTFQFRWAQDTSNATATTIYAESWMRLERLA